MPIRQRCETGQGTASKGYNVSAFAATHPRYTGNGIRHYYLRVNKITATPILILPATYKPLYTISETDAFQLLREKKSPRRVIKCALFGLIYRNNPKWKTRNS